MNTADKITIIKIITVAAVTYFLSGHITFFASTSVSFKYFFIASKMLLKLFILFHTGGTGIEPATCGFGDRCSAS